MQFVFPLFLVALASILIPLIIHLFYFQRYRTEYFSNVQFLKELVEEKQNRSRLRNILVLLARMFFLIFLVLAFAQPFLKDQATADKESPDFVSLYIDNSYSMEGLSSETPVFQVAINKAREIIRSYPEGTSFQILTNHLSPASNRLIEAEMALDMIDNIEPGSSRAQLQHIYDFTRNMAAKQNRKAHSFWLSDFQKNSIDDIIEVDSTLTVFPIPLQPLEIRNISIDSCWFESPVPEANQENQLYVKLTNYGTSGMDSRIVWREGDAVKPVSSIYIDGGQSVIDTIGIQLTGSESRALILEVTDHPITFDNRYYLQLNARRTLNIMVIEEGRSNRYLSSAFQQQSMVNKTFVPKDRIVYSEFDQQDLIILDELSAVNSGLISNLKRHLDQGGNVLVFPQAESQATGLNELLQSTGQLSLDSWQDTDQEALGLNYEDFVFSDVFEKKQSNPSLPSVSGYYKILTGSRVPMTNLIRLRNGDPLINKVFSGNGLLYLSTAPLDAKWNSLGNHADIFIPMLYRMALSRAQKSQLAYTIGQDHEINIPVEDQLQSETIEVRSKNQSFIPSFKQSGDMLNLYLYDQISDAGFYQIYENDKKIADFAMNYSRQESDVSIWSPNELKEMIIGNTVFINSEQMASMGQFIQEFDRGKVFWKYCLIFAVVFLILESLLLRFFKN